MIETHINELKYDVDLSLRAMTCIGTLKLLVLTFQRMKASPMVTVKIR